MGREISAGSKFGMGTPQGEAWIDPAWTIGLLIGAIALFTINLGGASLRDWDEGIVAQVAREISRAPFESLTWLYPEDGSGNPYFNKPPLMHWLVALSYRLGGVNEFTSRLPGALLTASSVPLLYWIGREIFFQRTAAILSALVYLTMLPVVRQGRLAMLDGAVLCFFLFMMFCLLRSRRDLRWGLGVGFGFGLICLTKGILGILLAAIAVAFIAWDTPRLLTSIYLWTGVALGCLPMGLWYGAQVQRYGQAFLQTHFFSQSLNRVAESVSNNRGEPWFYLWEVVRYGVPWLLFLPSGFCHVWENRNLSWAKLVMLWLGMYFGVISVMQTKLPWYAMPLYPALAMVVGVQLNRMWEPPIATLQPFRPIAKARIWVTAFTVLAIVAWLGSFYYGFWQRSQPDLQLIFSTLALTLTVTAILIARQDSQFIAVLIWGTYLTLMLLMMSSHWLWELGEAYPVKPVATMIKKAVPKGKVVYTSFLYHRPSLNFYSERLVIPAPNYEWKNHWNKMVKPYVLLERSELDQIPHKERLVVGVSLDKKWVVVTRSQNPEFRTDVTALKSAESRRSKPN